MHSSILLYLGQWRRLERRTKANWNAPVSAFLTWCMAHEMQLGPAATLVKCAETRRTPDPHKTTRSQQSRKLDALSCIFTDLLHSIRNLFYVLDLVMWFRRERESQPATSRRGFKCNKEVALRRCHSSFCCLLPRRCKTGSSSLCFPSEHQQFRCHLFLLSWRKPLVARFVAHICVFFSFFFSAHMWSMWRG